MMGLVPETCPAGLAGHSCQQANEAALQNCLTTRLIARRLRPGIIIVSFNIERDSLRK